MSCRTSHRALRFERYSGNPALGDRPERRQRSRYVFNNADGIRQVLNSAIHKHTSIKYYATMDVQFYRTTADGQLQQTTARFRASPDVLSDAANIDINGIARVFMSSIGNFNKRGSNWIVDLVADFLITLAPYRPMQGSSYIVTPKEILHKKAIVNVQNYTDNLCFLWSILALSLIHI